MISLTKEEVAELKLLLNGESDAVLMRDEDGVLRIRYIHADGVSCALPVLELREIFEREVQ